MADFARMTSIPGPRWTDRNGRPCDGWRLKWKDSETSDIAQVYADMQAMIPQQNPTLLNSDGSLPNGGDVFGEVGKLYDLDVINRQGAVEWTSRNIAPGIGNNVILLPGRTVYGNDLEQPAVGKGLPLVNEAEDNPGSVPSSAALYKIKENVDSEADTRATADNALQHNITAIENAIDLDVATSLDLKSDEDGAELALRSQNLKTGLRSQSSTAMPTASRSTAGNMDSAMFVAFEQYGIDIAEIKALLAGLPRKAIAAGLGTEPTGQQLSDAFSAVYPGDINPGDEVVSTDTGDVWIMGNGGEWLRITQADIELAGEDSPGLAKHSALEGCIGYYVAGIGQVNGWSELKAAVSANTAGIEYLNGLLFINGREWLRPVTNIDTDVAFYDMPPQTIETVFMQIWGKIRSVVNYINSFFCGHDNTMMMGSGRLRLIYQGVYSHNGTTTPSRYTHIVLRPLSPLGIHLDNYYPGDFIVLTVDRRNLPSSTQYMNFYLNGSIIKSYAFGCGTVFNVTFFFCYLNIDGQSVKDVRITSYFIEQ